MTRVRENKLLKWICLFEFGLLVVFFFLFAENVEFTKLQGVNKLLHIISTRSSTRPSLQYKSIPLPPDYSADQEVMSLSASLLFSKLFHSSMGEFELAPYFWRAKKVFSENNITITTMITEERLDRIKMLVECYSGPISVTFHLPTTYTNPSEVFQRLQTFYESNVAVQNQVDLHVLRDVYSRQFNLWRNIARFFAKTEYIFNLDADFKPSKGLETIKLTNASFIYIVPAFEMTSTTSIPQTKPELHRLWEKGLAVQFHSHFQAGHGATMYETWFQSDQPYNVTEYHLSYEPYWIMKRDAPVWCDERFVGYGANKAACIFEMYTSGMQLIVLPDIFLVHIEHAYPESTREMERLYNRRLYDHFRVEICVKYKRKQHPENIEGLVEDKSECLKKTARPLRKGKNKKKTKSKQAPISPLDSHEETPLPTLTSDDSL